MAGRSALIVGATGATGRHLLKWLLSSPDFARVGEAGRRVTPSSELGAGKEKLEQLTVDYEKLLGEPANDQGLKKGSWDVVFITLGTTRAAAGSPAAFEKIDREYVIAAAKAAQTSEHPQRLVYLSSTGANAQSSFLYPKSKGLTEQGLAALGYSDTIVFRPGLLMNRGLGNKPIERITEPVSKLISFLPSVASRMQIPVDVLAKSIAKAGELGSSALPAVAEAEPAGEGAAKFTIIYNRGSVELAKLA